MAGSVLGTMNARGIIRELSFQWERQKNRQMVFFCGVYWLLWGSIKEDHLTQMGRVREYFLECLD